MFNELRPAILITIVMTVLTGLAYPLVITGVSQTIFHHAANGSLMKLNGKVIGSELIGQNFARDEYFHPRPSAAGSNGYDATASGGSNFGPANPRFADALMKRAAAFRKENPDYTGPIPADAITASASGLDPQISPANAFAQLARVARARRAAPDAVRRLVITNTKGREWGFLGEPRVNVLKLNLALDRMLPVRR